jgi:hypothetical protein
VIHSRLAHDKCWEAALIITEDVKGTVSPEEFVQIFRFVYDTICAALIAYAAEVEHQEKLLRPLGTPKSSEN